MLEHARLLELLLYDPCTCVFRWRLTRANNAPAGSIAGSVGSGGQGYRRINIDNVQYQASRLAWFYVYERWPKRLLDHRNGIRADDRIDNLREATYAENGCNLRAVRSKSGVRGVYWIDKAKKWKALIGYNGESRTVGYYDTLLAAEVARGQAAAIFHKRFASF